MILSRLTSIFKYVDRFYVARLALPTLRQAGVRAFRECVFEGLEQDLTREMMVQVASIRAGKQVNEDIIRCMTQVYVAIGGEEMNIYAMLEKPHLEATKLHTEQAASRALRTCSCPEYLSRAKNTIELERRIVATASTSVDEESCAHLQR